MYQMFFSSLTVPEAIQRFEIVTAWFLKLPSLVTQELKNLKVFSKGAYDVVTNVDYAVNNSFVECIKNNFPDDLIISEERLPAGHCEDFMHILDPIDLTRNLGSRRTFFTLYCFRLKQKPQFSIIQQFNPTKLFVATHQGLFNFDGSSWIKFSLTNQSSTIRWVKVEDYSIVDSSTSYQAISSRQVFLDLALGELDWFEYSKNGKWLAWDYAPFIDMLHLLPYTEINVCPQVLKNGYLNTSSNDSERNFVIKGNLVNDNQAN